MPTYEIEQYELHTVRHRVRAASKAEAVQFVLSGRAFSLEETLEFIEVADRYGLPAEEHSELCAELRAIGVRCIRDVIPSIREIEDVDADASDPASQVLPVSRTDSAVEAFDMHESASLDAMARQLERVAEIIELTYPHDADGRRVEGDSPVSGADVVERLAALEVPIREALRRFADDGPC
jgi:hypothetical protein